MKNLFLVSLYIFGSILYGYSQKKILVKNPTEHVRKEIISIPFQQFKKHFQVDTIFTIKDSQGKTCTHQLEKLGGTNPINVLVLVEVNPKQSLKLVVSKVPSDADESQVYARYVPERFDDFAWENDVVAFRIYGKALEGRVDDAQGMDYWAKRTNKLVINKWYKTGDYHEDHGEGIDYYSVGETLGLGDIGLYLNNDLQYTKHYRRYSILDNGPIRTTFKLDFDPQVIQGQQITLSKTISLDAGSNFNRIAVELENAANKVSPIAIGLALRKEEKPLLTVGEKNESITYWEPEVKGSGTTGTAVILPNSKISYNDSRAEQVLLITQINNGQKFIYYNGASWDRAGKIANEQAWNQAVQEYKTNLQKPLKVLLK